jgi:hypothetical protein
MLDGNHVSPVNVCSAQCEHRLCGKRVKKLQLCICRSVKPFDGLARLRQSPRIRIERSPDLTETKPRDRFIAPFLATVSSRQHSLKAR